MDPHWVPIWEQNDVQKVVAQLPVGSPGADRVPKAFQNTQGLILIALGVRFAGLGPLWVSVLLALDLDYGDMVSIFGPNTCRPRCLLQGFKGRDGREGGRGAANIFISRLAPITHASHTSVPASRQLGIEASHRTTLAPVGSACPCELRVSADGASRRTMHTWERDSLNTCRVRDHLRPSSARPFPSSRYTVCIRAALLPGTLICRSTGCVVWGLWSGV